MLSVLLAVPVIGMLAVLCLPKTATRLIQITATAATAVALGVSLAILGGYDAASAAVQFEQRVSWIPQMNIFYHVGLDGLSIGMVVLTTLLSFLACLASWTIQTRQKEYFALYLLLEAGMLGTFLALDLFLFYIFWELVLVPMYFLIGIWGGGRREYSAFKFFVYTLAGSLFMLLGVVALYLRTNTFDMLELARTAYTLGPDMQKLLFLAFFCGFAIKVPIVPFHTWLPDAHVDAPTPISVILAGVLLKMGGYGFFRISYPLFPEGAQWFAPAMAVLGMINIVYGAFCAMSQTDFKKLVAYSSVSHMGFVLLGLASFTPNGTNGALMQMFNHGTITAGMFLLVGVLYERAHTRQLDAFGGLGAKIPVYSGLLIFFSMASLGLPGLSGFVSEFLTFVGTFGRHPLWTSLAVLGVIGAAVYSLTAVQKVLLGPLNEKWKTLADVRPAELVTLVPLVVIVLAVGVSPALVLNLQDAAVNALVQAFR